MTAAATVQTLPTLESVAHAQTDELCDVIALIVAAEERLESAAHLRASDPAHHALRLLQMARSKTDAVVLAFDPFI